MTILNIAKALSLVCLTLAAVLVALKATAHNLVDQQPQGKYSMAVDSLVEDYTQQAFDKALKSRQMVVLDFYKDGCPTCRKQHPVLEKAANIYTNAKFFRVNFDTQGNVARKFGVSSQGTIIIFNKGVEINRSTGKTSSVAIMNQIKAASSVNHIH